MVKSTFFTSLILQQDIVIAVLINSRHKDVVVENIIKMWVNTFGVPDKILTDNGGEFNNEELCDMSENLNTEVLATAAESPWSNGICERHNAVMAISLTSRG